jgi:hypothetical protein
MISHSLCPSSYYHNNNEWQHKLCILKGRLRYRPSVAFNIFISDLWRADQLTTCRKRHGHSQNHINSKYTFNRLLIRHTTLNGWFFVVVLWHLPLIVLVTVHCSCIVLHCSCIVLNCSCIVLHCSCIVLNCSCIVLNCSCIVLNCSCIVLHCSCIVLHCSCIVINCSCIVLHCSCIVLP